jgi:hypothetical protein
LFTGRQVDILDANSLKIQYNRNRYYDSYTGSCASACLAFSAVNRIRAKFVVIRGSISWRLRVFVAS